MLCRRFKVSRGPGVGDAAVGSRTLVPAEGFPFWDSMLLGAHTGELKDFAR